MAPRIHIKQQQTRFKACQLDILVIGAGLAGLGSAIACALAGHKVHVLEATQKSKKSVPGSKYYLIARACFSIGAWRMP